MRRPSIALVAAILAMWPVISAAATVAQILASPSTYDGQHVDVTGKVQGLQSKTSHKGNAYVTFSLCASGCVHVFAFGSPNITDGQALTVHGTFSAVKHTGGYTFYNEIEADDGSL